MSFDNRIAFGWMYSGDRHLGCIVEPIVNNALSKSLDDDRSKDIESLYELFNNDIAKIITPHDFPIMHKLYSYSQSNVCFEMDEDLEVIGIMLCVASSPIKDFQLLMAEVEKLLTNLLGKYAITPWDIVDQPQLVFGHSGITL